MRLNVRHGCALLACTATFALGACHRGEKKAPPPKKTSAATAVDSSVGRAPAGARIKVEVLNATRTRGLARTVALYLRDRGYDVVSMGNSGRAQSNTIVIDRSRHPEWARLLVQALRADSAVERPDTLRYLDATVIIGTDWAAPALPFYP